MNNCQNKKTCKCNASINVSVPFLHFWERKINICSDCYQELVEKNGIRTIMHFPGELNVDEGDELTNFLSYFDDMKLGEKEIDSDLEELLFDQSLLL